MRMWGGKGGGRQRPTLARAMAGGAGAAPPADPLAALYGVGPGRIAIHHATTGAVPAGGPATALTNLGGSGAYHNAVATAAAHPVEGSYLRFASSGGYMSLLNPADLSDVHLMFVMDFTTITSGLKLFGSSTTEISLSATATDWRMLVRKLVGGTWSQAAGALTPITTGPQLCEVTFTATTITHFINGKLNAGRSDTMAVGGFPLVDLGRGNAAGQQFDGLMGDVLGVTLGAGADAATATALAYLNARFGRAWAR